MARKQTPIQKLVTFAMNITEDELNAAMETLKAIKDSRFPSKKAQSRKPRSDAGTKRTPAAAATDAGGEE